MSNFIYKIDCPICDNERKDCRQSAISGLYFCLSDYFSKPGFKRVGSDSNGFGIWKESESSWQDEAEKRTKIRKYKKEQERVFGSALSEEERGEEIQKFFDQLILDLRHYEDLKRRGFSDELIKRVGFKSVPPSNKVFKNVSPKLPGFWQDGTFHAPAGYFCPAWSIYNKIQGFQIRTDSGEPKYIWSKSPAYRGAPERTAHLPTGELPLSYSGNPLSGRVGLLEGILKPHAAAAVHGDSIYLGAAGGNFKSSKAQFSSWIRNICFNLGTDVVTLYPDSGSLLNPQVRERDLKTCEMVRQAGFKIQIADWGQLFDKSRGDWDEQPKGTDYKLLDWQEYYEIVVELRQNEWRRNLNPFDNLLSRINSLGQKLDREIKIRKVVRHEEFSSEAVYRKGCLPFYSSLNEKPLPKYIFEKPEDRLFLYSEAKEKGWKNILDTSPTGSGKSYAAGNYTVADFWKNVEDEDKKKIFYLTKSSRNPSTEGIEENYLELATRHNGFKEDENKLTPLGNPQRLRAKRGEKVKRTRSNCWWSDRFTILKEKNRKVNNLCGKCPFQAQCKVSSGEGYGFQHEIKSSLSARNIRANIKGLSPSMVGENSVIILDEYTQALDSYKLLEVSPNERSMGVTQYRERLKKETYIELLLLLDSLSNAFSNNSKYGLTDNQIREAIGEPQPWVEEVLKTIAKVAEEEEERDLKLLDKGGDLDELLLKDWLYEFLQIWLRTEPGSFYSDTKHNLYLLSYNGDILKILEKSSFNIFQDATGSVYDLSNRIRQPQNSILHCSYKDSEKSNLTITNLTGLGLANKERSELCDKRIAALVSHFEWQYGDSVGFIDWKVKSKKGWLNHFSDGRGSNAYQNKEVVVSFGAPYPNLGALAAEYTLWHAEGVTIEEPSEGFQQLCGERLAAEILQEIGRIRSNRRPEEQLQYFICSDIDVKWLAEAGYTVFQKEALAVTPEAGDRAQQTAYKIFSAFQEIGEVSISKLSKFIGKARSTISDRIKSLGGIEKLCAYVEELLFEEKLVSVIDQGVQAVIDDYLPLVVVEGLDTFWDDIDALIEGGTAFEDIVKAASLEVRVKLLQPLIELLPPTVQFKIQRFYLQRSTC